MDTDSKKNAPKQAADGLWIGRAELTRLETSLMEAQETLDAIRNGDVDAVVVSGTQGSQIYSLSGVEHPYRIFVEQMQEGALTVAKDGLILYCNQRFADMVGAPLDRIISSNVTSRLDQTAWQRITAVLEECATASKHESHLSKEDGQKIPAHFTASPLPLSDQTVICLVVTDLSAQKRAEELRLAKDLAEQATIVKDQFLATLSHELRTPLTPVLMAISSLEHDHTLSRAVLDDIGMMRRNLDLEVRLIDDLLDVTRIAHGKLAMHHETVDIHVILGRAVNIFEPMIAAKGLICTKKLGATTVRTIGDPIRLQQVLWNVICNAIKFTLPGGSITISTVNLVPDTIRVSVTDTGIGFDSARAPQLFQAFEQTGRAITHQYGGLGLGLSISRSLILAHAGNIWGESSGLNRGATFHIELPIRAGGPAASIASDAPTTSGAGADSLRILLVEDHNDTRNALSTVLKRKGHFVNTASSAEAALRLAGSESFDMVISDLGLPDLNGTQLMILLRDRYSLPGIAVSGYGMEEDVRKSKDAGFAHHLTKPIDVGQLDKAIADLGRQRTMGGRGSG